VRAQQDRCKLTVLDQRLRNGEPCAQYHDAPPATEAEGACYRRIWQSATRWPATSAPRSALRDSGCRCRREVLLQDIERINKIGRCFSVGW